MVAKKEKKDIARNLLRKNMNIEDIADVTGLTIEEINTQKK